MANPLTWRNVGGRGGAAAGASLINNAIDNVGSGLRGLGDAFTAQGVRLAENATTDAIARAAIEGRMDLDAAGKAAFLASLDPRANQAEAMAALNAEQQNRLNVRNTNQDYDIGVTEQSLKDLQLEQAPEVHETNMSVLGSRAKVNAANAANAYSQIASRQNEQKLLTEQRQQALDSQAMLRESIEPDKNGVLRLNEKKWNELVTSRPDIPTTAHIAARDNFEKRAKIDLQKAKEQQQQDRAYEVALYDYKQQTTPMAPGSAAAINAQKNFEAGVTDMEGDYIGDDESDAKNASANVLQYSRSGLDMGLLWALASASTIDGKFYPRKMETLVSKAIVDNAAKTKAAEDAIKQFIQ